MARQNHIIRKLVLELEADSKEQATQLQEEAGRVYHDRLEREIQGVFDVLGKGADLLRIESLELNIGHLSPSNFEEELVSKIIPELYEQVEALIRKQEREISLEQDVKPTGEPGEVLRWYLESGSVPWWVEQPASFNPVQEFENLQRKKPDAAVRLVLTAARHPHALERLLRQIGHHRLEGVLRIYVPLLHTNIQRWFELLTTLFHQPVWAAMHSKKAWSHTAQTSLWKTLATTPQPTEKIFLTALENVAVHTGKPVASLLNEMSKVVAAKPVALAEEKAASIAMIAAMRQELESRSTNQRSSQHSAGSENASNEGNTPDNWREAMLNLAQSDAVQQHVGANEKPMSDDATLASANFTLTDLLNRLRHLSARTDWTPALLQRLRSLLGIIHTMRIPESLHAYIAKVKEQAAVWETLLAAAEADPIHADPSVFTHQLRVIQHEIGNGPVATLQLWKTMEALLSAALPPSVKPTTVSPIPKSRKAQLAFAEQTIAQLQHTLVSVKKVVANNQQLFAQLNQAVPLLTALQTQLSAAKAEKKITSGIIEKVLELQQTNQLIQQLLPFAGKGVSPYVLSFLLANTVNQLTASVNTEQQPVVASASDTLVDLAQAHAGLALLSELRTHELPARVRQRVTRLLTAANTRVQNWEQETDAEAVEKDIAKWVRNLQRELKLLHAEFGPTGSAELSELTNTFLVEKALPDLSGSSISETESSRERGAENEAKYTTKFDAASQKDTPAQQPEPVVLAELPAINRAIEKLADAVESAARMQAKNRKSTAAKSFDEADQVYLSNAGLVVVWPFLQRFFTKLNLLDAADLSFHNKESRHRALCLLQVAATGSTEIIGEHLLPLNKLLTNTELDEPIQTEWKFTEAELEEAENLVMAVIANVPMLGNSTIPGFRTAFMQREGVLQPIDGGWQLRVERKTHDIIIDKVPWGMSAVTLPWMEHVIYVEW